jgi:putative membrane protein
MDILIRWLIYGLVVFILAYLMPSITVRNYGTALIVALLIGVLNATVGFLLRLPLNILTLGLLSFFVRLLVTAVVIKLVDKLMRGFEVRGFTPALIMAVVIAITGSVIDAVILS